MAKLQKLPTLSIIIPTLNEARHLPLLLADLKAWPHAFDVTIVDGGSNDLTMSIARIQGIKAIKFLEPNRGYQQKIGALEAKGDWLLFLHADSRLEKNWVKNSTQIIKRSISEKYAWYFNFKINNDNLEFRILEIAVALRSNIFQRPYGDQGLLIHKNLYYSLGGFSQLKLMEDLEFVTRISKKTKLKSTGTNIYTDGLKWNKTNIVKRAIKNFQLRRKWKSGYDIDKLYKEYYL
tara:strand:- start:1924 stop:2628 length:705 start_codon:yes stop_codon:yes gene_type:complete